MTGRRDVATDLAQETLLRAHQRWADVATFDAPAAWCRKVMVNLLIDHHRSARPSGLRSNDSVPAASSPHLPPHSTVGARSSGHSPTGNV